MCERELETEQNSNILTPTLLAITTFFSVLLGCSTGGLGAHSAGCWLSLPHLVTNGSGLQTNWLPVFSSYIIGQRLLLLVGVTIAIIEPIHGQGYNILIIPRPDATVIYIGAFSILTARPGCRSIYNNMHFMSITDFATQLCNIINQDF